MFARVAVEAPLALSTATFFPSSAASPYLPPWASWLQCENLAHRYPARELTSMKGSYERRAIPLVIHACTCIL